MNARAVVGVMLEGVDMSNILWTIAGILIVLWLLGFLVGNFGSIIHIVLVIAVVLIVFNLVTRGRRA